MRALISFVLVAITVVVQLTIVDRIAFPGGAGPNLVLIAVAALGLASGPMAGVLTGFWGGLALDVAPPGSHFTGQNALVFCLVGYFCGLLADETSGDGSAEQGHTALFEILVVAAGAICGEALVALLGVMLSDPRVTWPAITNVLPAAVAYDALLCPFVLYAVAAALRLAGPRDEGARVGWSPSPARTAAPAASQGAVRQVTGGNTPRLRLAERGPASLGARYGSGAGARPGPGREPRLKLGKPGASTGPAAGLGTAFAGGGLGGGPVRVRFGGRRGEGVFGGSLLGGARPGGLGRTRSGLAGARLAGSGLTRSGLAGSGLGSSMFSSSRMGRSLLGGSVFSRSSSWAKPSSFGQTAPLGRSSPFRHRANLMGSPRGGLAGHAPRFSRGSFSRGGALGRLGGVLRRSAGPKSPGRGWLRDVSPRRNLLGRNPQSLGGGGAMSRRTMDRKAFGRGRLGRGWTGARTLRLRTGRAGPTRLHMPRPRTKRRWRTGGYR